MPWGEDADGGAAAEAERGGCGGCDGLDGKPGAGESGRAGRTGTGDGAAVEPAEYNNTVRDFLGLATKPAARFPDDNQGHGYDNIGDVPTL